MTPLDAIAGELYEHGIDDSPDSDRITRMATSILDTLTKAGHAVVAKPDAKKPTPALIEAAYVAQDSLSSVPDVHTIAWTAEIVDAYIAAQGHDVVHVLGHAAAAAEAGEA